MNMLEKAIITSCSNKFFPSVINFINSVRGNYSETIPIFVYDLGLSWNFRKELECIEHVSVVDMPHFCGHWRSCYTWKTYIFTKPFAKLNLYLDAGCQVVDGLEYAFEKIGEKGYYIIEQGEKLGDVVPLEYRKIFSIDNKYYLQKYIDAGVFGFKDSKDMAQILGLVYGAAVSGLCLGFSPRDKWRNKGKNKSIFTRGCETFRHDLTVLNIFFRQKIGEYVIDSDKPILKIRLNYMRLRYLNTKMKYSKGIPLIVSFNRLFVNVFVVVRGYTLRLRGKKVPYMDLQYK